MSPVIAGVTVLRRGIGFGAAGDVHLTEQHHPLALAVLHQRAVLETITAVEDGQEIAARNSYRPRDQEIAKDYEKSFVKIELFTIDDVFGGWSKAQKEHFGEGGIFDQIYKN